MRAPAPIEEESLRPVDQDWIGLAYFARHLIDSSDLDPVYPILAELGRLRGYDREAALWLSVYYQAYYHLPSGLTALRGSSARVGLPTGIERRGLRGGKVLDYLDYLRASVRGSLHAWITQGWTDQPYANYRRFASTWQSLPQNGRWSTFKMAEILKVVHRLPIAAPDMDLKLATGPREGLEYLYALHRPDLRTLNRYANGFAARLYAALGRVLDWETIETILCNWNSTRQGKYYVGHDIDEMQAQIEHAAAAFLAEADLGDLWSARQRALPPAYLGEHHGWSGVQLDRQRAWLIDRQIVTRG